MMDKAQSNKQASKSSKRRSAAIAVAIRETNKRLRPSSEPRDTMSTPITGDQNMTSTSVDATKKKRGPTHLKMVAENNYQKMELEFNEFGQVVGHNSDKFVSIAGAIVREYVPVVIKNWPSVDDSKKIELWNFIQEKSSKFSKMRKRKNPNITGLRMTVWTYVHLRKDGNPINEAVAETLMKIKDCAESISDTPVENSIRDDAVA
ncbi:uncharacterized protein LOC111375405 [Olea europaea var. sylvestris]|uniref:uncharacterized protein LOC111375405 n=1 Tax=Olea europaea var. sylvestris TaxID=158386 RepID=UPI000C1D70AD|nr:uncharacterized protein LOC111375405 [Olea europaea var. sylvestris]